MRLPVAFLIALTALSTSWTPAAAKAKLSPAEASATRLAFERGKLIYAYDRAAWQGTDDMVAKVPDYATTVGGWIVDGPADAPTLVFYDRDEVAPHAVYTAAFKGGRIQSSKAIGPSDDRGLSPERRSLIAARTAAVARLEAASPVRCKEQPFNTVVLPPEKPGAPTLVYFMTPQSDSNAIPMGGHYRVEIAADGSAGKPRSITETCLEMAFQDSKGIRPAALVVTDPIDPVPTEIHVFSSLASGLPILVSTRNKRVWAVDGTGIRAAAGKRR